MKIKKRIACAAQPIWVAILMILFLAAVGYAAESGSLQVVIEPEEARINGAWSLNEVGLGYNDWFSSGDMVDHEAGLFEIEFKPIPDSNWITPQPQTVDIVAGQDKVVTVEYQMKTGNLKVFIEPEEVRNDARWRAYLVGDKKWGQWRSHGDTVELFADETEIEFNNVSGWVAQEVMVVDIPVDGEVQETGYYTMRTGDLVVAIDPEEAVSKGAMWRMDEEETWNESDIPETVQVGEHTVFFQSIEGWRAPEEQTVRVVENETIEIKGNYEELRGALAVTLSPDAAVEAGAKWRVDGGDWLESGADPVSLRVGEHLVEYGSAQGWTAPLSENIIVEANAKVEVEGLYVQDIPKPIIRIEPTSLEFVHEDLLEVQAAAGNWTSFFPGIENESPSDPKLLRDQSDESTLQVRLVTPGMNPQNIQVQNADYQAINLGPYRGDMPAGHPNLPVIRSYIHVPNGKTASLNFDLGNHETYQNYRVYPVQPARINRADAEPTEFSIEQAVYDQDEWLPKDNVYLGPKEIIRGRAVQLLSVCPFRYNPAKQILEAYPDIKVNIQFDGQAAQADVRLSSPSFDRFFGGVVVNPEAMGETPDYGAAENGDGCDYLIITPPEFETAAQTLQAAKIARGIDTVVATTDETGKIESRIKDYIQTAYDEWTPAPTYILFLGDVEWIPTSDEKGKERGTDLYYSTVDGGDYKPDVFLGRIPVDTLEQAETVVQKIIQYETAPPKSPPFYANAFAASYFQDTDEDGVEDRAFIRTVEEIRNFMLNQGYEMERIYYADDATNPTHFSPEMLGNEGDSLPDELLRSNGFGWDGDADDISSAINRGSFLAIHRDHGVDRNSGYDFSGWEHPRFDETNVAGLQNGNLTPVVFSVNCQSGWFDGETYTLADEPSESFAELMLRYDNGGAVGVIAANRDSLGNYNDALLKGLIDAIWPDFLPVIANNKGSVVELGPMLAHAKFAMSQICWNEQDGLGEDDQKQYEMFHLFGDPSMAMWIAAPQSKEQNFIIHNDGNAELQIKSMTNENNAEWLEVVPKAPFSIEPGQYRIVTVRVDWEKTSEGLNQDRIVVASNDEDRTPYPDAVVVMATDKPPQMTLELDINGKGTVIVDGKEHEPPATIQLDANKVAILKAAEAEDWLFMGWDIDGESSFERTVNLLMNTDKSATANFQALVETYSLHLTGEGVKGGVKVNDSEQIYKFPWTNFFFPGEQVKLEAFTRAEFIGWSGDIASNENPITVTMDSDKEILASFVDPNNDGWDAAITVQSEEVDGISFKEWLDGKEGAINSCQTTIGVAPMADFKPMPADYAPEYYVKMALMQADWNGGQFLKDIRAAGEATYRWGIEIYPYGNVEGPKERTATLSWNPNDLPPSGFFRLIRHKDEADEDVVVPNMRTESSFDVVGGKNERQYFILEYSDTKTTVDITLNSGWNIVSLPVDPDDPTASSIFPDAAAIYEFDSKGRVYQLIEDQDSLRPGVGYWVNLPADGVYPVTGSSFNHYEKTLSANWHLMGAVNAPAIPSCEEHIEVIYGFFNDIGYEEVQEMTPGNGYWVKIGSECSFVLNGLEK